MSWVLITGLAGLVFGGVVLLFKPPRGALMALGAALLFGLTGYVFQGSPGQSGSPTVHNPAAGMDPALWVTLRQQLNVQAPSVNAWLLVGDALVRHGNYQDAVAMYQGGLNKYPGNTSENAVLWLATANALTGHAGGLLTPAAHYAYGKALTMAPDQPGPPWFLGLAMAQSGRFGDARKVWAALLAKSAASAPWRADLEHKLVRLDQLIAAQNSGALE